MDLVCICLKQIADYLKAILAGDGTLGQSSLTSLLTGGWKTYEDRTPDVNGLITSLHFIKQERNDKKLVLGGVDDGGIAVWDLSSVMKLSRCDLPERLCSTLKLLAQWTIFTAPLLTVIPLDKEGVGRLRGCIICVSDDGTLGVITLDSLELSAHSHDHFHVSF